MISSNIPWMIDHPYLDKIQSLNILIFRQSIWSIVICKNIFLHALGNFFCSTNILYPVYIFNIHTVRHNCIVLHDIRMHIIIFFLSNIKNYITWASSSSIYMLQLIKKQQSSWTYCLFICNVHYENNKKNHYSFVCATICFLQVFFCRNCKNIYKTCIYSFIHARRGQLTRIEHWIREKYNKNG